MIDLSSDPVRRRRGWINTNILIKIDKKKKTKKSGGIIMVRTGSVVMMS